MSRERDLFDQHEERLEIYARDGGVCRFCSRPVDINSFTIAHRIANCEWAIKKYGRTVIDHPLNKATTHGGCCNDGMLITFKDVEREALVAEIRLAIEEDRSG
jgi:hypothetical protein